jgi:methionyl-tRNA synthetase
MYVWLDALTNYITAVGYPDVASDTFERYWPADLHIIGKDILRFHAVYWPAFLMSGGIAPPKRVFTHGMLLNEGQKMSKSLGNVIAPQELIETFGVEQTRYYLMREVPFGGDGSISREFMGQRINSDLANDFGNLAQRSLSMIGKNCSGAVPQPGDLSQNDKDILKKSEKILEEARAAMDVQAIHDYLAAVWKVIGETNGYFAHSEPWALKKTDPDRMATVLYVTAEVVRRCAIMAQPVVPDAMGKLLDQLAVPAQARTFAHAGEAHRLTPGTALPAPEGVFPRHQTGPKEA